jgi:predicted PurR-regulated permease PerM
MAVRPTHGSAAAGTGAAGTDAAGTGAMQQAADREQPGGLRSAMRWLWRGWGPVGPAQVQDVHTDGGAQATAPDAAVRAERADRDARPGPDAQVPRLLRQTAAWSWRLLLTGLVVYIALRIVVYLRLVTLPLIAATLLAALLQPLAAWLRRRWNFAPLLATWCTFLLAIVIIGGAVTLMATQISDDYPTLFAETKRTVGEVPGALARAPFHLSTGRLSRIGTDFINYISQHKSVLAGTVLTTGKYAAEFAAGIILFLFISFFLIKDGDRIWLWLTKPLHPEPRQRSIAAGDAAWRSLVSYMRGTTTVAVIHSIVIGLALWLLGVPLVVPFIILIFLAAYIPLVGILIVGALAILVALATKGWVAAVILLAVLIVENQIESHLLQPLVIGRFVHLHPLAIILALAVGGILAGIPGAIIAVPTIAVITSAWSVLHRHDPAG